MGGCMVYNDFVDYLNTLHNESAGNAGAVAEAQRNNPYFQKVLVQRPEADFIAERVESGAPFLCVLTGYAGDGKTTILFRALERLGMPSDRPIREDRGRFVTESGKTVSFIKDFSELPKEARNETLREALALLGEGISTLLVANTGPIIESFKSVFTDKEDAESVILERMDATSDYEQMVYGYPMLILNIARIDNSDFLTKYGMKLVAEGNWSTCQACERKDLCPIYFNAALTAQYPQAFQFLNDFYIWEQELDNRATIRQITAHIAFALTGGLNCHDVWRRADKYWKARYLYSNLLFTGPDGRGSPTQIKGIRMLAESGLDTKNTSKDYSLFVQKDYKDLLPLELVDVAEEIDSAPQKKIPAATKQKMLKRMMLVFALNNDIKTELYRDIFATYYPEFLDYRAGRSKPSPGIKNKIFDALQTLFTGDSNNSGTSIYVTLRRSGEQVQNVQMLIGRMSRDDLNIISERVSCVARPDNEHYELYLVYRAGGNTVKNRIGMPLLDYFTKISAGLIVADVDPLLSHGIESLKAELMAACKSAGEIPNVVNILVQKHGEWHKMELCFEEDRISEV